MEAFLSKILAGMPALSPPSSAAAAAAVAAAAAAARPTWGPSRLSSGEEGGSSHGALTMSALKGYRYGHGYRGRCRCRLLSPVSEGENASDDVV